MEQLMTLQEEISLSMNTEKIGHTMKVIIDREDPDYFIGRTEFDSPEVDGEVLIDKGSRLQIGHFYNARVHSAMPFDLMGEII